jgi:hypothetical protein
MRKAQRDRPLSLQVSKTSSEQQLQTELRLARVAHDRSDLAAVATTPALNTAGLGVAKFTWLNPKGSHANIQLSCRCICVIRRTTDVCGRR